MSIKLEENRSPTTYRIDTMNTKLQLQQRQRLIRLPSPQQFSGAR